MSSPTPTTSSTIPNPFPYGWRFVRQARANGQYYLEQVPLTLEDVLHPQEGDVIPENTRHERLRRYIQSVIEHRLSRQPNLLSVSDCLIDWGHPRLRPHSPDLVVLQREQPWPWGSWSTIRLRDEEAQPLLVVEITSPSTRYNDVSIKPLHYCQVGVPFYILVDQETEEGPLHLLGYERVQEEYQILALDDRRRLLVPPLGLYFQVSADRVALLDAKTGQELGDYTAVCAELEKAVKSCQEAERLLGKEQQLRAEEAKARAVAERLLGEEQRRREDEATGRRTAERELAQTQDKMRQLEEQLRRLQNQPPV